MTNPFHPYPEPRLTVELVPKPLWGTNLRSRFTKGGWDLLRKACYTRAGNNCECCGNLRGKGPEAHEIWEYDDLTRVQRLKGLISLCFMCHRVKHIGYALTQGHSVFSKAVAHLASVNQWPIELAQEYVDRQFQIVDIRSELTWTQDISWTDESELYIAESEAIGREARGKLAESVLAQMRKRDADK